MSDKNSGTTGKRVFLTDGYTVAPNNPKVVQNGFQPTTGQLGTPPKSGSAVSKPPASK